MTQRIFDTDNADDMALLWSILPDGIIKISPNNLAEETSLWSELNLFTLPIGLIKINWHDKTEITRPIQEATEADIGKLCYFKDGDEDCSKQIGLLTAVRTEKCTFKYVLAGSVCFAHCRRLTKQEIEELI
jgi:hypothetical protein